MTRALLAGFILWAVGAAATRAFGHAVIPSDPRIELALLSYVTGFICAALLVRGACAALGIEPWRWPQAAAVMLLPTLVLDAISLLAFREVYPNMDEAAVAQFGGLILISCAGALIGVSVRR